jgi:hypothetical protein
MGPTLACSLLLLLLLLSLGWHDCHQEGGRDGGSLGDPGRGISEGPGQGSRGGRPSGGGPQLLLALGLLLLVLLVLEQLLLLALVLLELLLLLLLALLLQQLHLEVRVALRYLVVGALGEVLRLQVSQAHGGAWRCMVGVHGRGRGAIDQLLLHAVLLKLLPALLGQVAGAEVGGLDAAVGRL